MVGPDAFYRILFTELGFHLPQIITCLIGMVLSVVRWSRRPRQCMLVMLASVINVVFMTGYSAAAAYILSNRSSMPSRQVGMTGLNIVTAIVATVPFVLLFVAALGGRSDQAAFPVRMPPPFAKRS